MIKKLCAICLCFGLGIGLASLVSADIRQLAITILSNGVVFQSGADSSVLSGGTANTNTFGGGNTASYVTGGMLQVVGTTAGGSAGYAKLYSGNAAASHILLDARASDTGGLIDFSVAGSSKWTIGDNGNLAQTANGRNIVFGVSGKGLDGSGISGTLLINGGTVGTVLGNTSGLAQWTFDNSGNLTSDATRGGNVVFAKGQTGVRADIGTLAAAGTTQSDAAAMVHIVTRVTGADGTKGVNLPALATVGAGARITVINSDVTNALKVYSNAAGETIDGQSGTTALSVAAKLFLDCFAYDASNWYCDKGVLPF